MSLASAAASGFLSPPPWGAQLSGPGSSLGIGRSPPARFGSEALSPGRRLGSLPGLAGHMPHAEQCVSSSDGALFPLTVDPEICDRSRTPLSSPLGPAHQGGAWVRPCAPQETPVWEMLGRPGTQTSLTHSHCRLSALAEPKHEFRGGFFLEQEVPLGSERTNQTPGRARVRMFRSVLLRLEPWPRPRGGSTLPCRSQPVPDPL